MSLKVGITGESGFIGSHLKNYLSLKEEVEIVPYKREYFENENKLKTFLKNCDVLVHLAAKNRTKGNPEEIYNCNVNLIKKIIANLKELNHNPHIIFSSSTQEERDNPYGRSKKDGRELFINWANKYNGKFTGLVIPNVFGPFGEPYYNSVIATFSYQLTHDEEPRIDLDSKINLIYINNLVEKIAEIIFNKSYNNELYIPHLYEITVSDLLKKLKYFKEIYFEKNIIPELASNFEVSLFNTFRSYISYEHPPVSLEKHADDRGYLFENIKSNAGGQVFFSSTKPGITRGNHFHRRKVERFCVVEGEAIIRLRKVGTDKIIEYKVYGDKPSFVDIPIHHTHNITNIGRSTMLTLFWTNEFFDPQDSDTYFQEV